MTVFQTSTSHQPPRLLSGADYDAVGESSQDIGFFLPGSSHADRVGQEKSGFHSTIRGRGVTPRPQGSHPTPGAAFVTDNLSDTGVSPRSTPAARSPGWLLGSPIPHS